MRLLLKALFTTGASTLIALSIGTVLTKLIAIFYGPSGLGTYSLLKQFVTTAAFLCIGSQSAIVQSIASTNGRIQTLYVESTLYISSIAMIAATFTCFLVLKFTSITTFGALASADLTTTLVICASVTCMSSYAYLKSLLNGHKRISSIALIEIVGPLIAVIVFLTLTYLDRYSAILIIGATILAWQLGMAVVATICANGLLGVQHFHGRLKSRAKKVVCTRFIRLASLTVGSTLISASSLLLIKYMINKEAGLEAGGFFEAAWTISSSYVMILLGAFGTYYLPTFAAESNQHNRISLVAGVFKVGTVASALLITTVILFKPLIVQLLYSRDFFPSLELMKYMLIGDYFKVAAWVFAIPALARGDVLTYFKTEAIWWLSFVAAVYTLLTFKCNLQSIAFVFCVMYCALMLYYTRYISQKHGVTLGVRAWGVWFAGLLCITSATIFTWNIQTINLYSSAIHLGLSVVALLGALGAADRALLLRTIRPHKKI